MSKYESLNIKNISPSWSDIIRGELKKDYFHKLADFLAKEKQAGKTIYPQEGNIFRVLELTPLEEVKVVILGQDPYHGEFLKKTANGEDSYLPQAQGLAFSVPEGAPLPPSLRNIFKEIASDCHGSKSLKADKKIRSNGDLTSWAKQGVLLLNAVLTVEANNANSHANLGKDKLTGSKPDLSIGWETFTDKIISEINSRQSGVVFMLWGKYAQQKRKLIDENKHHILVAPHPSPLSAHRGFLGCKHFSQSNELLHQQGKCEISW